MRLIYCVALLSMLVTLPGCSFSKTPSWLKGDWIFDLDASQKALSESTKSTSSGGPLNDMATAMSGMLLPVLADVELRITDTEIMTLKSGNGKSLNFEVISSVPDQECLVKKSDGTLQTFYKEGDDIYTYPDSGGKMKLLFKRKS